jgi:hypothetical protein
MSTNGRRSVIPSVGLYRTPTHAYHWNGGPAMPGVTSVIGKIDKSGPLIAWAKGVTADAALNDLPLLAAMAADKGAAVAKAYLTAHATGESDAAKALGTKVHTAYEALARGETVDLAPEHLDYVHAYGRFRQDWQPEYLSLEHYVANLHWGYGGTFDFIARIDGKVTLGDYKTGKGHYTETRLQLAGLGHAEFLGMPNDPRQYPLPAFEQYVVLHVRPGAYPDGYQLYRVDLTHRDFQAFLGALAVYRWAQQQPTKGEPMPPPGDLIHELEESLKDVERMQT